MEIQEKFFPETLSRMIFPLNHGFFPETSLFKEKFFNFKESNPYL